MANNKDTVRQHYENVSRGEIDRDREIVSPEIVHKSAVAGVIKGIDAFLLFVTGFKEAFPDLQFEVLTLTEAQDVVVAEGVVRGTNTGPMIGPTGAIPATGRSVELPFVDVWEFEHGLISENRIYYDQTVFLGQLGLLPVKS